MERKDSTTNIHNIHTQTYTILTTNHNSSHKVGTPSYKPTKLHNTHKKSRVGHKKSHLYIYIYIYILIQMKTNHRKKILTTTQCMPSIPPRVQLHTTSYEKKNSKDSQHRSSSPINHKNHRKS